MTANETSPTGRLIEPLKPNPQYIYMPMSEIERRIIREIQSAFAPTMPRAADYVDLEKRILAWIKEHRTEDRV
jgi:hypothetical protein